LYCHNGIDEIGHQGDHLRGCPVPIANRGVDIRGHRAVMRCRLGLQLDLVRALSFR